MNLLRGARIVCIGGTYLLPSFDGEPAAGVLRAARKNGAITSFDVTWDVTGRWYETIRPMLREADVFMPSVREARYIAGSDEPENIARFLLECGVRIAVIKLGSRGCYVRTREQSFLIDGYRTEVVDTTGAGDAFAAGFLTGMARGWPLDRCGLLGNAVGALCVRRIGATAGVLSLEQTLRFMSEQRRP